jgi:hypothetical protein
MAVRIWILILLLLPGYCFAQDDRLNLAVAEFEARNVSQMDALAISDFLRTELVKSGMFKVLDRSNMDKILEEQAFQTTGCTTQECAVKMGKILNVQKIVIGILTKLMDVYFITASVVNVQTGEIELSERIKSPTAGGLADASEELGRILVSGITGKDVDIPRRRYIVPSQKDAGGPHISKVIDENQVKINAGFYDGVKKRNLYTVHKGAVRIAKIKIISVEADESTAKVIWRREKEKIEPGMPAFNKDNKDRWRAGGIGGIFGFTAGEDLDTGGGGALYYDCIFASGWGFQLNLGLHRAGHTDSYYDYDYMGTGDNVDIEEEINIVYSYPVIIKRHIGWHNPVSPYLGIGLCQATYKYEYNYYSWTGWFGSDSVTDYDYNEKNKTAPVLNFGMDIMATRIAHLILDIKYFIGGEDWYDYNTNLTSTTFGVSINW